MSSRGRDRSREVLLPATSAPALGAASLPAAVGSARGLSARRPQTRLSRPISSPPSDALQTWRREVEGNGRAGPTRAGRNGAPALGAWRICVASAVQKNPYPLAIPRILFPSSLPGLEPPSLTAPHPSVPSSLSPPPRPGTTRSIPAHIIPFNLRPPAKSLPGPSSPAGQAPGRRAASRRWHPCPPSCRRGLERAWACRGRWRSRGGTGPGRAGRLRLRGPEEPPQRLELAQAGWCAGAGRADGGRRAGPTLGFLGSSTHARLSGAPARFPGRSPLASPLVSFICTITPRWVLLLFPLFRFESGDTLEFVSRLQTPPVLGQRFAQKQASFLTLGTSPSLSASRAGRC